MQKIRKNILLSPEENDLINNFADRVGLTFSEFIRKTALEKINKEENVVVMLKKKNKTILKKWI